jgi:transposase
VPRAGGTRSESDRCHHRQPEREKRRKRGACIDAHGYDAGKKIKGKKRHVLVDTLGLLLHAIVHPADIQDRDGGILLLATLFGMYPFLQALFADAGYQGRQFHSALKKILPHLRTQIVKRSDQAKGFVVLPSAGSLSARWRGSTAAVDSPRIGRTSIAQRSRFCASPQSGSCSENFVILTDVFGQTLTKVLRARIEMPNFGAGLHREPLFISAHMSLTTETRPVVAIDNQPQMAATVIAAVLHDARLRP